MPSDTLLSSRDDLSQCSFDRPPIGFGLRGRALRVRRWKAAASAVRFAVRILSLARARLTPAEEQAALSLYIQLTCAHGALEARPAIRSALFAAGQLVDDAEIDTLCQRAGHSIGDGALQFAAFAAMLSYRKRKFQLDQDTSDTTAAFESLMDPASRDIDTHHLLALCREFHLSDDVEALIMETDADGSGKIDLDEFAALLEAEVELGDAGATKDADGHSFLDNIEGACAASSSVPRATQHRRAARQATHSLYVALRRRLMSQHASGVAGGGTFRGNLSMVQSMRLAPSIHHHHHAGEGRGGGTMGADSAAAAAADVDEMIIADEEARQRRQAEAEARRARRFEETPYKPEPPPPCPYAAEALRRHQRELGAPAVSVGERLSPRRPPTASKAETARARPFGSSAARFSGEPVLDPLPGPSLTAPIQRREHPADVTSIYKRPSAVPSRNLSPATSRGGTPRRGHSPSNHGASARSGTAAAAAPSPAPMKPPPDYATFNPFLGLPPLPSPAKSSKSAASPRRPPSSSRGAAKSLYARGGSAKSARAGSATSHRGDGATTTTTKPPRPHGSATAARRAQPQRPMSSDVPPELARASSTHSAANYQLVAEHVASDQRHRRNSTKQQGPQSTSRPASAATSGSATSVAA